MQVLTDSTLLEAVAAAQSCKAVYPEFSPRVWPENTVVVARKNARVIVETYPDFQDITYAGSNDCADWWGNFHIGMVRRSHVGLIYDGVADYHDLVREMLIRVLDPQKPKRFRGHSLGGGAAKRAAAGHAVKGGRVDSVHTFGAPMVGNQEFADIYKSCEIPTFDWWAPGDLVPYQPNLLGIPLGYKRDTAPLVLGPDGIVSDVIPNWLVSRPWRTWTKQRNLCHSIKNYNRLLPLVQPTGIPA